MPILKFRFEWWKRNLSSQSTVPAKIKSEMCGSTKAIALRQRRLYSLKFVPLLMPIFYGFANCYPPCQYYQIYWVIIAIYVGNTLYRKICERENTFFPHVCQYELVAAVYNNNILINSFVSLNITKPYSTLINILKYLSLPKSYPLLIYFILNIMWSFRQRCLFRIGIHIWNILNNNIWTD